MQDMCELLESIIIILQGNSMTSDETLKRSTVMVLGNFLPYRLATLSNRISGTIASLYEDPYDMSVPEWRVMAVTAEESDISAAQVAERTALDKVAVSRAVNKLIDAGRLERHFAKEDRRRSVLSLSEEGIRIYNAVAPLAMSYEKKILDELDDSEKDLMNQMLDKLHAIQWKQDHPDES